MLLLPLRCPALIIAALFYAGAGSVLLASTVTIASTFGPGNTTLANPNLGIGFGPGFENEFADSFTPSATFSLTSISVAVENISGPNQLTVDLASGTLQPGSPIESFSLINIPSVFPGTVETATSSLGPLLVAGIRYWIVVSASDPDDTFDGWAQGLVPLPGELFLQRESAISPDWFSLGGSGGAFSVVGTPVPEPATGLICLGAVGAMALIVQRRRVAAGLGINTAELGAKTRRTTKNNNKRRE